MIKKTAIVISILFFVACGTNKGVVRTSKSTNKTKPVVITTKKEITSKSDSSVKVSDKPINNQVNEAKTETLEATSKVKVTTELVLQYINKYKSVAMDNMKNHGVPASISLAQAILESGAGTGNLSQMANNHFGIKCHKDWQGPSVNYDDDELQECFRKYDNVYDSYQDYATFLKGRKWYEPLFKLEKKDYKGWANGLKKAGYATDPKYPSKLIGLIERYQLQKYDAEVLGIEYVENKQISTQVSETKKINTENSHQVVKGDTLYSISKRYNISIDDIKKKNNISENAISIGQVLEVK